MATCPVFKVNKKHFFDNPPPPPYTQWSKGAVNEYGKTLADKAGFVPGVPVHWAYSPNTGDVVFWQDVEVAEFQYSLN